jgi:hypothetical protein
MKDRLSVPKKMQARYQAIIELTDDFAAKYLDDEYAQMCREMTAKLARKRPSPLERGRVKSWAAGVIHAICTVNFGFDKSLTPHITIGDLREWFQVGKSTPAGKSKEIRDLLRIDLMEPEWTLPSRMDDNPMAWSIMVDGLIVDVRYLPRAIQEIAFAKGLIPYIPEELDANTGEIEEANTDRSHLGKLPPRYTFFLNPYPDLRYTRCPSCDALTKVRKHPFFIHIDPVQPLVLNMSGRFCPDCDLLILHQDQVEHLMASAMQEYDPSIIGNEYLIVGTLERKGWRATQKTPGDLQVVFDHLHDFKEVVIFEPSYWHWAPDNADE